MAELEFTQADVGLWSDLAGTLVALPRITVADRNKMWKGTTTSFDGDDWDTPVTGEGRSEVYDMSVLLGAHEHAVARDLEDLFDLAHESPDSRLQFRGHTSDEDGVALHVVGVVYNLRGQPMPARPVTMSWTVTRVSDD